MKKVNILIIFLLLLVSIPLIISKPQELSNKSQDNLITKKQIELNSSKLKITKYETFKDGIRVEGLSKVELNKNNKTILKQQQLKPAKIKKTSIYRVQSSFAQTPKLNLSSIINLTRDYKIRNIETIYLNHNSELKLVYKVDMVAPQESLTHYIDVNTNEILNTKNNMRYSQFFGDVYGSIYPYNVYDDLVQVPFNNLYLTLNDKSSSLFYSGSANNYQATMQTDNIIIPNLTSINLTFNIKYVLENGWDFLYVQISTNNGSSWNVLNGTFMTSYQHPECGVCIPDALGYTGNQSGFEKEIINLKSYANRNITIRFIYLTDTYLYYDGAYLDNISIESENGTLFFQTATSYSNISFNNFKIWYPFETYVTDESGFFNISTSNSNLSIELEADTVIVENGKNTKTIFEYDGNLSQHNLINITSFDNSQNHAESNVYYHVNKIHDYFTINKSVSYMDYKVPSVVMVQPASCNAYYDGYSLNFIENTSSCNNPALWADIIYHEYVHGITGNIYDNLPYEKATGAMDEAFSDFFAYALTQNSKIGENWKGPYIRNINNTKRYPEDLVNPDDFTTCIPNQQTNDLCHVHTNSEILGGALFDLSELLGIKNSTDLTLATMIFQSTDSGITFESFLDAMLIVDDNNSNIADMTPNFIPICNSFMSHGINSANCTKLFLQNTFPNQSQNIYDNESLNFTINYIDLDNTTSINWYFDNILTDIVNVTTYAHLSNLTLSGIHTINVTLTDASDLIKYQWNLNIVDSNIPPIIHNNLTSLQYNETDIINITLYATDLNLDHLTYNTNSTKFTQINNSFIWNTTLNDSGIYFVYFTVNDSYSISSITYNITILNLLDTDNDGIPDHIDNDGDNDGLNNSVDFIFGNQTNLLNNLGFNATLIINNSTNLTQYFAGIQNITLEYNNLSIVSFQTNLSESNLNLNNIIVKLNNESQLGHIIVSGINLSQNQTKTVLIAKKNYSSVCIKDQVVQNISEISIHCNGTNEYFLPCNSTALGQYICEPLDNNSSYLKISGLNHSAVQEYAPDLDNDGFISNIFGGLDCNDVNENINPSKLEICGNLVDENCDGTVAICPSSSSSSSRKSSSSSFIPIVISNETSINNTDITTNVNTSSINQEQNKIGTATNNISQGQNSKDSMVSNIIKNLTTNNLSSTKMINDNTNSSSQRYSIFGNIYFLFLTVILISVTLSKIFIRVYSKNKKLKIVQKFIIKFSNNNSQERIVQHLIKNNYSQDVIDKAYKKVEKKSREKKL